MDFSLVATLFTKLAATSSKLEKEALLRRHAKVDGFTAILMHIYNPYVTTGIKAAKLFKATVYAHAPTPEEVLEYFSTTKTGDTADVAYAAAFINSFDFGSNEEWLATGIITKHLSIGVSATTLNNVYGKGFIPIVGIMRGTVAPESFSGRYIATEKIDGNRRLFFNFSDRVEVYTRSGHADYGLKHIADEIHKKLPDGFVYDCECIADGAYEDSLALRQASASILNRGANADKTGTIALCFDMVDIKQYNVGESLYTAAERKYDLACLFNDRAGIAHIRNMYEALGTVLPRFLAVEYNAIETQFIKALPILGIVRNEKDALDLAMPIWDAGGEGLMLVQTESTYQVSATPKRTWLKIKNTLETLAYCTDIYPGDEGKRLEGTLGGITVTFKGPDGKYYACNCGSGFPDYMRDDCWAKPDSIIGKVVEIEFFGYSKSKTSDGYSLNCPRFKRIHNKAD